jgi:hypothetical protein
MRPLPTSLVLALAAGACAPADEAPADTDAGEAAYVLGSVVIGEGDVRTTYVQTLPSLDVDHVTNAEAIEAPGNGVMMVAGRHVLVGLAEEPTWVRYTVGDDGRLEETGRISFQAYGMAYVDYGNAVVDATTAVSISSSQHLAIFWNPETLEITGTLDLPHLAVDGYEVEVWTTVAHDGRVYVPSRWSDWEGGRILPKVQTTILDPVSRTIVGVAEDDRCSSGGRVLFGADGTGYVLGDGRNYSLQMFANARGDAPPANCLLRILPGATDFDPDWVYTVPSLTGGLEVATELEGAGPDLGVGFASLFYPDRLPDDVEPVDFGFWSYPAFKMWSFDLDAEGGPVAREVDGLPFSVIGFGGSEVDGRLVTGQSADGATSTVYAVDPATSSASGLLTMDGYFYGLHALGE